jgi:hypothetical protein
MVGLSGLAMVVYASPALAAGEEVTSALNRAISWILGAILPLAVLMFILGAVLLIAAPTVGGAWRGRTLMITAVLGLILAYLAYPIFNLVISFTH